MYESIPQELKDLKNWVGWKLEKKDDKLTKVPYSSTHARASSTDPNQWRNFNDVSSITTSKERGIGFVFYSKKTKDGKILIGIDLDKCLDENGDVINEKILAILQILKSYIEISPSGRGLHIIIKCTTHPYYYRDLPTEKYPNGKEHFGKKNPHTNVEIYSQDRFFTMTGNKWKWSTDDIKEYSKEVIRLVLDPILLPEKLQSDIKSQQKTSQQSSQLDDDKIIEIASKAQNAQKFNSLMSGSIIEYNNDRSAADMALASILAFYTTDINQIERIMRRSGLVRDKWNRVDYIQNMTISKAIRDCSGSFDPTRYGNSEEGKNIFDGMEVKTKEECSVSQSDKDINEDNNGRKLLAESAELTKLPPFPGTNHKIFGEWMNVASQISYSRVPFHYFTLMGLCTMILGKRVRVVLSGKSVYSNMFIHILGTTSVSGKSFALDMTTDEGRFLPSIQNKTLTTTDQDPSSGWKDIPPQNIQLCKFMIQNNKLMEPRMIQDLAKINDNMIWYFDEAQTFYMNAANNNSSILPQLCLIYDGKSVKSKLSISKKKEKDKQEYEWSCEKPFGTLIFAMTDDQFDKLASSEQSEGGFLPRFMFIYEQGGEVRENVDITPEQQSIINRLVGEVQYVAEKLCILNNDTISFKVCPRIEKWKVEETNKYLTPEYKERRIAIQRLFIQVYKIAMVLSITDLDFLNEVVLKNKKPNGHVEPISIDLPDKWVEEALIIAEKYLLPRTVHILQKANDANAKSNMSRIMKVIRSNGGSLERQKIGKYTHIEKKLLDEALLSLVENNELDKARTLENGHWIERYCLMA